MPVIGLLLAALLVAAPDPVRAAAGPPGPNIETGVVKHVADGDTFDVYQAALGQDPNDPNTWTRVRVTGINAPEIGHCGDDAATNRLKQLIDGKTVTLSSIDPKATGLDRALRHVHIDIDGDGNLDNVSEVLLQEGLVWSFPHMTETTYNALYLSLERAAQAAGVGMWDDSRCGAGPYAGVPLSVWAMWDADGEDGADLNGEYVVVENGGVTAIDLAGWQLRDSALNIYQFPPGATLPANGSVTVYVGAGTDDPGSGVYYWDLSAAILDNDVGDGVYLLDPRVGTPPYPWETWDTTGEDVRAYWTWPCTAPCSDPLQGKVDVNANIDASGDDEANPNGEWIHLVNTSGSTVDVSGYILDATPERFLIPDGTTISPGGWLRIYPGSGSDTATKKYMGKSGGILNNLTDRISLQSKDGAVVAELAWPCSGPCGDLPSLEIEMVNYDAPGNDATNPNGEWIKVTNVGSATVNFKGWQVTVGETDFAQANSLATRNLAAGESLVVYVGSGTNTANKLYMGRSGGIMANGGSMVKLKSPKRDVVDCFAWGTVSCPADSDPGNGLTVTANFDAAGNDTTNPNGEWVNLANDTGSAIDVSGYTVASWPYETTLPAGSVINPGERMRIYVGSGSTSRLKARFGRSSGILNNGGDGVQLRNPQGDLVGRYHWPCSDTCGPLPSLEIETVNYNAPGSDTTNPNGEWIKLRNTGTTPIDLRDWQIQSPPYQLNSHASRVIAPGGTFMVYIGPGSNTTSKLHWQKSSGILNNSGDVVKLLSPHRDVVDCVAWGSKATACPAPPVSEAVTLTANYDAAGSDSSNPNGEWINIANEGPAPVDLAGYVVRNGGVTLTLDGNSTIQPGERMRVHIGSGTPSRLKKYMGQSAGILGNSGETVELLDGPTVVASFTWPCAGDCGSVGDVVVAAVNADAPGSDASNPNGEWIQIENRGTSPVDLRDWMLWSSPYQLDFSTSRILDAGEVLTVYIGSGTDTASAVYWGHGSGILGNSGDAVELLNPWRVRSDCFSWGSGSC